ncbi:MAG: hypothetical protein GY898_23160 [Proteobacteria bacterium]|nr:hypothetical protein [Pseudomonadota bacterium]
MTGPTLPFDDGPTCPGCDGRDVWVLGLVGLETFLSCRDCSRRWKTFDDVAGAVDREIPVGMFDAAEGDRLRDAGIASAAASRAALLWFAKATALHLGRTGLVVCADDVQRELKRQGHDPEDLGNAAGALFRGPKLWRCVGFRNSERTARQSGAIREWVRRDVEPPLQVAS